MSSTKQQRYRERKTNEGYKQVVFLLSPREVEELDRKAVKSGSRLKAAQKWLRPRKAKTQK